MLSWTPPYPPPLSCPVDFNFDLKISTRNDSAGNDQCPILRDFDFNLGITFLLTENLLLFADSPADHVALSKILTINKCSNRKCVDITIQDDLVWEQRESFHVMLEKPPGFDEERIKLGIVKKEVTILDDDGEWD